MPQIESPDPLIDNIAKRRETTSANNELPYYDDGHNRKADCVNDTSGFVELIVHVHVSHFTLIVRRPSKVVKRVLAPNEAYLAGKCLRCADEN
jgi:hypothetical protein